MKGDVAVPLAQEGARKRSLRALGVWRGLLAVEDGLRPMGLLLWPPSSSGRLLCLILQTTVLQASLFSEC